MEVVKVWLCEYDGISGGASPCLHKVNSVTTTEGRVASEDHTWGLVDSTQVTMDIREVLQTSTADELEGEKGGRREGRG